jgi:hypothetical protein
VLKRVGRAVASAAVSFAGSFIEGAKSSLRRHGDVIELLMIEDDAEMIAAYRRMIKERETDPSYARDLRRTFVSMKESLEEASFSGNSARGTEQISGSTASIRCSTQPEDCIGKAEGSLERGRLAKLKKLELLLSQADPK